MRKPKYITKRNLFGFALFAAVLGFFLVTCEGPVGPRGLMGPQGLKGDPGVSIIWKGELSAPPADAQLNWAYYNTTIGNAYIYDGANWQILSKRGENGTGGYVAWQGEKTDHPADPQLNWAYYNSTDKKPKQRRVRTRLRICGRLIIGVRVMFQRIVY